MEVKEAENSLGEAERFPCPAPDEYWLRTAASMVEAMSDALRPETTLRRREILAEYIGGILDDTYNMGIKLGAYMARMKREQEEQAQMALETQNVK